MSLYSEYIYEREGKEIVETENGFATYSFLDQACYIQDIYVREAFRSKGEGSKMADMIANIAKSKGYNKLYGTVVPSTKGATISLKSMLSYGFSLDSSANNLILLVKEI